MYFVISLAEFDTPRDRRFTTTFDLRRGDVLLCRTNGTLAYVGMSALVPEDQDGLIFPDKVIRVRATERVAPEFLWMVFQTPPLRAQIEAAARTAVGNYAIGGADIWNFEFPLPPIGIQRKLAGALMQARAEAGEQRTVAASMRQESAAEIEERILGR